MLVFRRLGLCITLFQYLQLSVLKVAEQYDADGWFAGIRATVTIPKPPQKVYNSLKADFDKVFSPISVSSLVCSVSAVSGSAAVAQQQEGLTLTAALQNCAKHDSILVSYAYSVEAAGTGVHR